MAARIAGVTLPQNKRIEIALTYIYGIGRTQATKIIVANKMDPNIRTQNLSVEEQKRLSDYIEKNVTTEGDLRRERMGNIKRLREIGAYRGTRHARGLPARGQRTKTNSRTVRGNVRRTMGSGRRSASEKT
jgi:small subunit ribosomal protein S13